MPSFSTAYNRVSVSPSFLLRAWVPIAAAESRDFTAMHSASSASSKLVQTSNSFWSPGAQQSQKKLHLHYRSCHKQNSGPPVKWIGHVVWHCSSRPESAAHHSVLPAVETARAWEPGFQSHGKPAGGTGVRPTACGSGRFTEQKVPINGCASTFNMCVYFFVFVVLIVLFWWCVWESPIYIAYFLSDSNIWDIGAFFKNLAILVSSFPCVSCLMLLALWCKIMV